jgi:GxxExxY protein
MMLHENVTERVIAAALKVHTALGAGLLESAYHASLRYQFTVDGLTFDSQLKLPVVYGDVKLEAGDRIDFLVENRVIVEIK